MINTNWGGVVEDNSFGTHEYFELCEQLGCDTYVNGNVGSGTVQEMSEWVEYMTFGGTSPMAELRRKNGRENPWVLKYLGVGNESWGCGGNMDPEYYGCLLNSLIHIAEITAATIIFCVLPQVRMLTITIGPKRLWTRLNTMLIVFHYIIIRFYR